MKLSHILYKANNLSVSVNKFKDACIKVGQPHLRFHDIRHSFCSNLALKTTDAYLLQNVMRHSSLQTTQNYLSDNQLKWVKQVDNVKVIA